ncbi:hypothetical protein OH77DRAFT_1418989 [Trametes cingulata]|nr:hypothetical protein OH77DRAFT_1418989 [Trametes cingulata]
MSPETSSYQDPFRGRFSYEDERLRTASRKTMNFEANEGTPESERTQPQSTGRSHPRDVPRRRNAVSLGGCAWWSAMVAGACFGLAVVLFLRCLEIHQGETSTSFWTWSATFSGTMLEIRVGAQSQLEPVSLPLRTYIDDAVHAVLRGTVRMRDFALKVDGGKVYRPLTTSNMEEAYNGTGSQVSLNPDVALSDDLRIGRCWKLSEAGGQLGIRLPFLIYPTHVTIDHIPREIAADIGQAPRNILVWGLIDGEENRALYHKYSAARKASMHGAQDLDRMAPLTSGAFSYVLLSTFAYDIYAPSHIQTFEIEDCVVASGMSFGIVVVEVLDNWGGRCTCLYRVRIHGKEAVLSVL